MIAMLIILAAGGMLGCVATVMAVRNDGPGRRPDRFDYDSRHPQ